MHMGKGPLAWEMSLGKCSIGIGLEMKRLDTEVGRSGKPFIDHQGTSLGLVVLLSNRQV